MSVPAISDCSGLWRRTLLIGADGSRDTEADVFWLQGITAYVDSRGFAGTLHQSGDVFEWHRDVDLEPPTAYPDAGAMTWKGDTLVETGVHEDYVEHWVCDDAESASCWALFLSSADFGAGLLMRVGNWFGWAGGTTVLVGPVGGPPWTDLAISLSSKHVEASGARWHIERSEGSVKT